MITTTYDPEQWQLVPKVMTGGMLFRFGETTKPYGERWRNTLAIAPQHESQWQPIETAPKDCNIILFGRWWSDEQGWMKEPVIGRWNQKTDGRWEFANAGGWWGIRPTVWTPLPQHPNTIKVPRPEGHDSWSIEIKTSGGGRGGGGGGKHPDTGETTQKEIL